MVEEHGVIIKVVGAAVMIKAERTTSCEGCSSKSLCHSSGTSQLIEADNRVGAKVGDHVVFTVGAGSVLKAGLILYLVPVIAFILGAVLGRTGAKLITTGLNPDLASGVLGVFFLIAAFAGIKLYSARISRNKAYRPQVLRVV